MPPKKRRSSDKHATKDPRRRILNAASKVFSEDGFAGARVDRIAERAGVNKAMLYYHVGDKEALYEAVLVHNFALLTEAMEGARISGKGAEQQLTSVVGALVETLQQIPDHPRLMVRELAAGAADLPAPVVEQMARVFKTVRTVLEDGRREGVFRDVNPLLTHLAIVGSIVFLIASGPIRQRFNEVLGVIDQSDLEDETLGGRIADLILNGIRKTDE
jgi:AcrR family transcriptional regulator